VNPIAIRVIKSSTI